MTALGDFVLKHAFLVHVPMAMALLLPWALVAAQRPGRGIKPWWTVARYLGWMGWLASWAAVLTEWMTARSLAGGTGDLGPVGRTFLADGHASLGALGLVLGALTLRWMHRKREEHQGLGLLPLVSGWAWCVVILVGGSWAPSRRTPVVHEVEAVKTVPVVTEPPKPQPEWPWVLDYLSLEPLHVEPVKSPPHGHRWVRAWANAEAAAAYRAGGPLPEGGRVVLSTLEDRWGRPGFEPGPLYGMERRNGELRFELQGLRGHRTGEREMLESCRTCHASGFAPVRDRSTWGIPKPKPKAVEPQVSGA